MKKREGNRPKTYRGALHIHTIFSDGQEPLERWAELLKAADMDFIAVSDHAESFDDVRMREYVALCRSLSEEDFLVIPGLEFSLFGGEMHMLGYGITERLRATGLEELVGAIQGAGGLAVLAHPARGAFNLISGAIDKLNGIEVWNGRYDGRYSPRPDSVQLLRQVRAANSRAWAFCGIDLHRMEHLIKLWVEVEADALEPRAIIAALAGGRFSLHSRGLVIPSTGELTLVQELGIALKQPLSRLRTGREL